MSLEENFGHQRIQTAEENFNVYHSSSELLLKGFPSIHIEGDIDRSLTASESSLSPEAQKPFSPLEDEDLSESEDYRPIADATRRELPRPEFHFNLDGKDLNTNYNHIASNMNRRSDAFPNTDVSETYQSSPTPQEMSCRIQLNSLTEAIYGGAQSMPYQTESEFDGELVNPPENAAVQTNPPVNVAIQTDNETIGSVVTRVIVNPARVVREAEPDDCSRFCIWFLVTVTFIIVVYFSIFFFKQTYHKIRSTATTPWEYYKTISPRSDDATDNLTDKDL